MGKQARIGVTLAAIALLALIVYSTMQQAAHSVEVCVTYKGRTHCAKAAGATRDAAIGAAQQIGCSLITSGRDENMACLDSRPTSVRDLR